MDSELQIGLVALGVAAVVGIIAYNKWQERKHRRHAERAFRSEHRDVLLDPTGEEGQGGRIEPRVREPEVPDEQPVAPMAATRPVKEAPVGRGAPADPEGLDPRVDCIIRIESIEPLEAPRLWAAQREQLEGLGKPVWWFAFDDAENLWRLLGPHSAGAFHWFCAAMQMVDRHGAIGEQEFMRFTGGVQRVADQFLAVPAAIPARADALRNAAEVDRFCAGVDVQIGVNVVSVGQPFQGTKIRALAESHGMVLGDDGVFQARDDDGNTLFALCNLEAGLFAADEMRNLQTSGLTFVIDVPRVANGVSAFDRMMREAALMAEALHGTVVDDNRAPFGRDAAALIRSQIQQFQTQMAEQSIGPGSPLALRLFSA